MNPLQQAVESFVDAELIQEQRLAVRAPERLVVVRACPGAGKTRVFAVRFAHEVAGWRGRIGGVAALSFTNVAQEEVHRRVVALGMPHGHPHFIGTIDSFLLRFVVSRFGSGLVRLDRFRRPYDVGDYRIQRSDHPYGPDKGQFGRLSEFVLLPEPDGKLGLYLQRKDSGLKRVPAEFAKAIIDMKRRVWKEDGELTYADVCAVAWRVLAQNHVREIVGRRFPLILVDEFQDTTGLRAPCLRRIFETPTFERGFVVGDPDQQIMTFAGARRGLFEEFEALPGAASYKLQTCHRAHQRLASLAAILRGTPGEISCGSRAPKSAPVLLVSHDFGPRPKDLGLVVTAFKQVIDAEGIATAEAVVLAWAETNVRRLGGEDAIRCPFIAEDIKSCLAAVRKKHGGDLAGGIEALEAVAARILFKKRQPTTEDLRSKRLTPRSWRHGLLGLLSSAEPRTSETLKAWLDRLRGSFEDYVESVLKERLKLGPRFAVRMDKGCDSTQVLESMATAMLPSVQTGKHPIRAAKIHQVKGEEFPAVCVFIPAPGKGEPGALATLLGLGDAADAAAESRRVAYVGITRATRLLMLVIPRAWAEELAASQEGQRLLAAFHNSEPLPLNEVARAWPTLLLESGTSSPPTIGKGMPGTTEPRESSDPGTASCPPPANEV